MLFLAFLHEHNRPDRSSYVTVITENILDSRLSDFKKRDGANSEWFEPGDVDTQNNPFDFQSVLHLHFLAQNHFQRMVKKR